MVDQHVGGRDPFVPLQVVDALLYGKSAKRLRLFAPERVHDAPNPLRARNALQYEGHLVFRVETELTIQRLEIFAQGHAVLAAPGSQFHDQHRGADPVLVPDFLAGRGSDALLIAEEILISHLFRFRDHTAYVLEACQRLEDTDPVMLADRPAQVARDDGLYHCRFSRERPLFELAPRHVGNEERAGLVAVERNIVPVAVQDFDRHSVAVGIRGDEHLRAFLPAKRL